MNEIIEWSEGNPGAMVFLTQLLEPEYMAKAIVIKNKLRELKSIRGTNLYVLYSDLCNKDIDKVVRLLMTCPPDLLQDACSRQDYSGKEMIREYLKE